MRCGASARGRPSWSGTTVFHPSRFFSTRQPWPAPSSRRARMQRAPSLAELQRWLRWALTHPLGVHRAAAGEHLPGLPARFIEPDARALSFIAGDLGGRDAAERLSVHGTGYFARLHGTLRLEYPRLAGALGEDEFRVLIAAHLLRA